MLVDAWAADAAELPSKPVSNSRLRRRNFKDAVRHAVSMVMHKMPGQENDAHDDHHDMPVDVIEDEPRRPLYDCPLHSDDEFREDPVAEEDGPPHHPPPEGAAIIAAPDHPDASVVVSPTHF